MQTVTNLVNRAGWPSGPWDDEPDRVNWTESDLPCVAIRHRTLGHWCGYVGVPANHLAYGKNYDHAVFADIDVHWGLTYANEARADYVGIVGYWILGFDCAHSGDLSPGMAARSGVLARFGLPSLLVGDCDERYRDLQFVRSECRRLAEQINAIKE